MYQNRQNKLPYFIVFRGQAYGIFEIVDGIGSLKEFDQFRIIILFRIQRKQVVMYS